MCIVMATSCSIKMDASSEVAESLSLPGLVDSDSDSVIATAVHAGKEMGPAWGRCTAQGIKDDAWVPGGVGSAIFSTSLFPVPF